MKGLTKKVLAEIQKGSIQTWPQIFEVAMKHSLNKGHTPLEACFRAKAFVACFQAQGHTL